MNIYLRELKAYYKSFLIWSATMLFLIAAGMMKYSAFAKTGESINEIFKSMPAELMSAMGIDPGMDLSSIGVFYSIFFLYFLLLMAVHSCLLGASIIAKEERDKTADFLLVKPIRRSRAITAKVLAALTMVVLYNLVTFVFSVIFVEPSNTTGESLAGPIFATTSTLLLIQLLFLCIGFCLGAWASTAARASGIATAIILGTFMIKILIELEADLDFLRFLTPFGYFNSSEIMFDHTINLAYVAVCLLLSAATVAGTYFWFGKRDLRS